MMVIKDDEITFTINFTGHTSNQGQLAVTFTNDKCHASIVVPMNRVDMAMLASDMMLHVRCNPIPETKHE